MSACGHLRVAVDAEFLKTGGTVLARSVALVPFSLGADGLLHEELASSVIQLNHNFVLKYADVLPAGYSLVNLCEEFSDGLDKLFSRPVPPLTTKNKRAVASRVAAASSVVVGPDMPISRSGLGLTLDVYSVPNHVQFPEELLASLYEGPSSTRFQQAAAWSISKCLPFGPGRPTTPSMAVLIKRDATLFHKHLVRRFSKGEQWLDWLHRCREASHDAVKGVSCSLQQPKPLSKRMLCHTVQDCDTIAAFSRAVRGEWARLATAVKSDGSGTTFYAYGGADEEVLRNTIRLACMEARTPTIATSPATRSPWSIQSPMQLTIRDVTASSVFRAAGFEQEQGLTPKLRKALEKVADRNTLAQDLLLSADEHNPLWDAAALAAVCQVVLRPTTTPTSE